MLESYPNLNLDVPKTSRVSLAREEGEAGDKARVSSGTDEHGTDTLADATDVDSYRTVGIDYPSDVAVYVHQKERTESEETAVGSLESKDDGDYLKTVEEVTHNLFEFAIGETEDGQEVNIWLAFTQVCNARTYKFSCYEDMRQQLLEVIERELCDSPKKMTEKYIAFLHAVRKELVEIASPDVTSVNSVNLFVAIPKEEESPGVLLGTSVVDTETLKEMTPHLFESCVFGGNVGFAYEHLKRAHLLGLPEYDEMKTRFLELIEFELSKDIEKISKEQRRRLEELRRCLLVECWVRGTDVVH